MKYLTLILLLVTIFLVSCKEDPLSPQFDGQIMPLSVGNYWGYSYLRIDSLGAVTDTLNWMEVVDSDTIINGLRYYSVTDIITMFFGIKMYYINKSDGLYRFIPNSGPLSLYVKYPVKQNEMVYSDYDTLKVLNTLEKVITPAGTFYCIVYSRITFNNSIWFYENTYYSPGIGKVKIETGYTRDLKNYQPNSLIKLEVYKIN